MKMRTAQLCYSLVVLSILGGVAQASLGDRLPEFKECVQVRVLVQLEAHSYDS